MKTKVLLLVILLMGCFTVTAQTTHFIDWDLSVGANATITIDVGDTIEWEHTDPGMPHDVTSNDPNAPVGFGSMLMSFGDTYSFTFTSAVVFDYGCGIHPGSMDGTITVLAAAVCDPPTNLVLNNVTTTTADISWNASADETGGYQWSVFSAGANPVTATPINTGNVASGITNVMVTGLNPNTAYDFYASTFCAAGAQSSLSTPLMFTTNMAAGNLWEITVQFPAAAGSYGDEVTWELRDAGNVVILSGGPYGGPYPAGHTDIQTVTTANEPLVFYIEAMGTFNDNSPDYSLSCGGGVVVSGGLTGGDDATHNGLVCFVAPTCDAPTALMLNIVTETTADISWTASASETNGYNWVAMNIGDDPNTDIPFTNGNVATGTTMATITGLMADTMYQIYVQTNCGVDGLSDFSTALHIQTEEEVLICDPPTNIAEDDVSPTTATISWTASATETNGYEWELYESGDDPLVDPVVDNGNTAAGITQVMITGLFESSLYDFYVRSDCGANGLSDWEGPFTFDTDATAGINDNTLNGFVFYPNPAKGILYMQAQENIQNVAIYNLLGQKVISHQLSNNITELDVSGLSNGAYILKVSNSINETGFYKLLKQ